ncbi:MAG: glycosyltransferase family 2 protein [Planctomycetota bacterium]|jgi:cellulose synthase/poly-beta-1,6-N-acetylglucosamine synthase-like glycosyltransferase
MLTIEIIFWTALGLALYTLVGYPLLALVLAAIVRKKVDKKPVTPKVSLIIAAYNEENVIAEKIRQTLKLDYPPERLEIIVASDGSTDGTDEIVRSFTDRKVKLCRVEGRKGKTNALNEAVTIATGEILIFSDATGIYNRQAIRELAANFHDPEVGCVTGRVAYRYGKDETSKGFKAYQRFVVGIRRAESRFASQTSVSGSIHAIRRKLHKPVNPAFSPDMIDAVHTVAQGYRVIYENNAVALEESRTNIGDEFRCRMRISVRGLPMIWYILCQLLGNKKFGYTLQMISHKFMRWLIWLPLAVALGCNVMLVTQSNLYLYLAGLQTTFYIAALLGLLLGKVGISIPIVSSMAYFLLAIAATFVGSLKFLAGKRMVTWEPIR